MEDCNITSPYLDVVTVGKTKFPQYHEYVEKGWPLPNQPYSLKIKRAKPGKTTLTIEYYSDWTGRQTGIQTIDLGSGYLMDSHMMYQNAKSLADSRLAEFLDHKSNKLLSKIQAQALPLIQMYKERKETGKLVLGFLDDAIYTVRNLKHPKRILHRYGVYDAQKHNYKFLKSLKKRTLSADTAGNAWLQYRFAWTPLLHDIVDSYNAQAEREKKGKTFFNRVGDKFNFSLSVAPDTGYGDRLLINREGWYGMSCSYHITDETLASVGSIDNIASALWDMGTYTFVIDWVVDISTYLGLQTATLGTSFSSGCSTLFYKDLLTFPATRYDYYPNAVTWQFGGRRAIYNSTISPRQDVWMKRDVLTSFPTPKLEYPLAATVKHGVDLFFLINQRKSTLIRLFGKKPH